MEQKQAVIAGVSGLAILLGGFLVVRNLGSDETTVADLESVMHQLPTEELIARRQFMASQIQQAQARSKGKGSELLQSAVKSLEDLESVLEERGVDLSSMDIPDRHELADAMRQSEP